MRDDPHHRTPSVFLSYRREDAAVFARSLGERLKGDLRLENVFLDVGDLFGGDDWRRVIADRIAASDAVIALIGARWAGPRLDGGWRIFDDDDVVRWELGQALRIRPSQVIPTMLDGARLPHELPPELTSLHRAHRLNLRPPDSPTGYCELLADVFMKTHARRGEPILVTDGSDRAEVYLDELARQLKGGRLGVRGVVAVTAVTRGFGAITLREAATQWPDAIILRHPDADEETLAALARGIRRNTGRVAAVAALGGVGGVTFELGRNLIHTASASASGPAAGPLPSVPVAPASPTHRTPSRGSGNGEAARPPASHPHVGLVGKTAGLGLTAKVAGAVLVVVAVAVGAALVHPSSGPPTPLAVAPTGTAVDPPTPDPRTQGPASGIGTGGPGAPSPAKPPSIMPTECSTDPFWGTDGRQSSTEPGQALNCSYNYEGAVWRFSQIVVFDGTTPLTRRAQETRDGGRTVPVRRADAAWMIESPRDVNRILVSIGDESLYAAYHGDAGDAVAAVERLLK